MCRGLNAINVSAEPLQRILKKIEYKKKRGLLPSFQGLQDLGIKLYPHS
jgi:hypothetical protein